MRPHPEGRSTGDDGDGSFESLGVRPDLETVYRLTLSTGSVSLHDAASVWGVAPDAVRRLLTELTSLGLVYAERQQIYPVPPRIAVEALIQERLRTMETARRAAERLATLHVRAHSQQELHGPVDVVYDGASALRAELLARADSSIRLLSGQGGDLGITAKPGVTARIVYARAVLEQAGAAALLGRTGVVGRVVHDVPVELLIADDRIAMISATHDNGPAYVIHTSPVLTAVREMFELTWVLATPIEPGGDGNGLAGLGVSSDDLRVLTMLAAGMTDPAIARQLGVSTRTVQRRIRATSEAFGARSRLDLLLRLARRGLLGTD